VSNIIFETEKYTVERSAGRPVIAEDGKYTDAVEGYLVINRETNVVEHSTIMLPGAIFQAQHFNDTLVSLLSPPVDDEGMDIAALNVPDDIVPN
jgi:hypothetical protein